MRPENVQKVHSRPKLWGFEKWHILLKELPQTFRVTFRMKSRMTFRMTFRMTIKTWDFRRVFYLRRTKGTSRVKSKGFQEGV